MGFTRGRYGSDTGVARDVERERPRAVLQSPIKVENGKDTVLAGQATAAAGLPPGQ